MPTQHTRPSVLSVAAVIGLLSLSGCSAVDTNDRHSSSANAATASASAAPTSPTAASGRAGSLALGTPSIVVSNLHVPWSVVFVGNTPIYSERDSGRIKEILGDGRARLVGQVEGVAHEGGEGGLLGLALDDEHRLYAYSSSSAGNRVQRYTLTGSGGSYKLGRPTTIIGNLPQGTYHNGGHIAIGPDGMLYVAVGDTYQSTIAQDKQSLGGKILRMTLDGKVPDGNPFKGSFVYSYGHRNVQGMAWASDGTMFASEFGQDTWDELNIIKPGGNYGWPKVEGIGHKSGYIDPVQQWHPADASPSGITIVDDTIFIANLRGEVLRKIPVAAPSTATEYYAKKYGRLRAVTVAPDGALWIMTNNTDGVGTPRTGDDRILRIPLSRS